MEKDKRLIELSVRWKNNISHQEISLCLVQLFSKLQEIIDNRYGNENFSLMLTVDVDDCLKIRKMKETNES